MTQDSANKFRSLGRCSKPSTPTPTESPSSTKTPPRPLQNTADQGDAESLAPIGSVSDHDALVVCELTIGRIGDEIARQHPQKIARFIRASARHAISAVRLFRALATELPGNDP